MCHRSDFTLELQHVLQHATIYDNSIDIPTNIVLTNTHVILFQIDIDTTFINEYLLTVYLVHQGIFSTVISACRHIQAGTIGEYFLLYASDVFNLATSIKVLLARFPKFKTFRVTDIQVAPKYTAAPFYFAIGPYRIHSRHFKIPGHSQSDEFFFLQPNIDITYNFMPVPGILLDNHPINEQQLCYFHKIVGKQQTELILSNGLPISVFNFANPVARRFYKTRALSDIFYINTCSSYRFRFCEKMTAAQLEVFHEKKSLINNIASPIEKYQYLQIGFQFLNSSFEASSKPICDRNKFMVYHEASDNKKRKII